MPGALQLLLANCGGRFCRLSLSNCAICSSHVGICRNVCRASSVLSLTRSCIQVLLDNHVLCLYCYLCHLPLSPIFRTPSPSAHLSSLSVDRRVPTYHTVAVTATCPDILLCLTTIFQMRFARLLGGLFKVDASGPLPEASVDTLSSRLLLVGLRVDVRRDPCLASSPFMINCLLGRCDGGHPVVVVYRHICEDRC